MTNGSEKLPERVSDTEKAYDQHAAMLEIREFWSDGEQSEQDAFDRWLAAHDAEVRLAALEEAEKAVIDLATEYRNDDIRTAGFPVEATARIRSLRSSSPEGSKP